jgi:hypothetical protein
LSELLIDVGRLLRPTLGTDIEVTTLVAADVPAVFADPGQLMAALLCLAIGARPGLEHGGRIDIAARRISESPSCADGNASEVLIVLMASPSIEDASLADPIFSEIRMVEDFVRRSNGRLELKEPHGQAASVEIFLPRAERARS